MAGNLAGATHEVPTVPGRREPVLWGLVGNTPIIPLEPPDELASAGPALLVKAEWLNPGGSVKDRPAREILRSGFAMGMLPERRLIDSSSGNTAAAYAMLGAAARIARWPEWK